MSFEDEIENLKKDIREVKEHLGIQQHPAYGPPKYPKAYPLPKLAGAIIKILPILKLKGSDSIDDLVNALKTRSEAIQEVMEEEREITHALVGLEAIPTTKEGCEKVGGKWIDEKCQLPEKRETTESIAILPTSQSKKSRGERRANQLLKKIVGEK